MTEMFTDISLGEFGASSSTPGVKQAAGRMGHSFLLSWPALLPGQGGGGRWTLPVTSVLLINVPGLSLLR